MRFFRLLAIAVLLLACVVLGTACAEEGPQGPKGDTGADGVSVENIANNGNGTFTVNLTNGTSYTTDNFTGPQGVRGELGPSMIVAMGNINSDGTVSKGYNIDGVLRPWRLFRICCHVPYDISSWGIGAKPLEIWAA